MKEINPRFFVVVVVSLHVVEIGGATREPLQIDIFVCLCAMRVRFVLRQHIDEL